MLWAIFSFLAIVVIITALMLVASYLLGQKHLEPETNTPYESGVVSQGSAHLRISVKYYVVAMFFVVFDVEAVFIYSWAVSARESGWPGYIEMLIFIFVLAVSLLYLYRIGGLDWGEVRRHSHTGRS